MNLLKKITAKLKKNKNPFNSSTEYWRNRYNDGGNSGDGSYGILSKFKAKVLNEFVATNNINDIIEFGCGDGNQLTLAEYSNYLGFDISPKAIEICQKLFKNDTSKKFKTLNNYNKEMADLTLSLDVIFHLVEDDTFDSYMYLLFNASNKFVIIYASNIDQETKDPHVKHRMFTKWVENNHLDWSLVKHIPNDFPFKGNNKTGSFADFYIFKRTE